MVRSTAGLRSSFAPRAGKLSSSYSYKSKSVSWSDDVVGHDKAVEPSGRALREAMDKKRRSASKSDEKGKNPKLTSRKGRMCI